MKKDISIIVAFDNNEALMRNFIEEIAPIVSGHPERELVLAADGCRNRGTVDFARACVRGEVVSDASIMLIDLKEKGGYSAANNAAVAASTGEFLLFANTDIFPEPGAVELLRSAFDANPRLGGAQGRLLYPQNGKVMSTGHCFNDYMNHHLYQGRAGDDPIVLSDGPRQALNSAFLMMPRRIYEEFGGMDEFFYNAFDGMDLTLRVGQAGYDLLYIADAVAWHSTGGSRDYIRHNNEYQAKYFYAHTARGIKPDLPGYLAAQLEGADLAEEYFPVDCTFNMTWRSLVERLGIRACKGVAVEERDSSRIDLYRNLPPAVRDEERPLLFVVNNFQDIMGNRRWFATRNNPCDLVIDFFGNAFTAEGLGLAPGKPC